MNSIPMRADFRFKEMLDRIRTQRRTTGKDPRDLSDVRLTLAISRIPNIEDFVVKSNIISDDKPWRKILK